MGGSCFLPADYYLPKYNPPDLGFVVDPSTNTSNAAQLASEGKITDWVLIFLINCESFKFSYRASAMMAITTNM